MAHGAAKRLYQLLRARSAGHRRPGCFAACTMRWWLAGIGVMIADTEAPCRLEWSIALDCRRSGSSAPSSSPNMSCGWLLHRRRPEPSIARQWRSRLGLGGSMGGLFDLLGALPGVLAIVFGPDVGSLPGFVWAFKLVRYAPGLAGLQRVISDARQRPAVGPPRLLHRSARLRQPRLSDRARGRSRRSSARSRRRCGGRS